MTRKEFLAKYEKTFNPSDYDVDIKNISSEVKQGLPQFEGKVLLTMATLETIAGFRVQIFLTQEIDQANLIKDAMGTQLPDDWIYVVYDAPYYKVRVGNFSDRQSANLMVKRMADAGYKDAWIVPDNVYRNPPPKPPDILTEPERPLDQLR